MKGYRFIASDQVGNRREGLVQADSPDAVLERLRSQNLVPISIDEVKIKEKQTKKRSYRGRVKASHVSDLCWQLATMLEGGIPITNAIGILAEDVPNLQIREALLRIQEKVSRGVPFSEGVAEYPKIFNKLACAVILAGETSGTLAGALERVARYYDSRDKLIRKIRGALAYPAIMLCVVILIIIVIMTFIIPRFRIIFNQFGKELPVFSRAFMASYDFICHNIIYVIISAIVLAGAIIAAARTKRGHAFLGRMVLSAPIFGRMRTEAFVTIFCRTFATLVESGVPMLEILSILAGMTANDIIRMAIVTTREHVVGGSNLSLSMASSGFFPNMLIKMVQVGEESGSLPTVLERTGDHYERRLNSTIEAMTILLEPLLILTIGSIVLMVAIALYLPIFTMSGM